MLPLQLVSYKPPAGLTFLKGAAAVKNRGLEDQGTVENFGLGELEPPLTLIRTEVTSPFFH
jgi:hypothetical protein